LKIVKLNIFISLKMFPAGNHFTCLFIDEVKKQQLCISFIHSGICCNWLIYISLWGVGGGGGWGEWNNLPYQLVQQYVNLMRRRIEALIRARGSINRYLCALELRLSDKLARNFKL
jgi:hypothetical protein